MQINHQDVAQIMLSSEEIDKVVTNLAQQIDQEYSDITEDLVVIGVLNGSAVFMTDLIRKMNTHIHLDWMSLSSYGSGTKSSGVIRVIKDLDIDIKGKDVLIVEDILDSGLTLSWLVRNLKSRGAKSVEVVTLLKKHFENKADNRIACKWVGFIIPNEFVVGYGLDYAGRYRNLPYVSILSPEVYE